MRNKGANEFKKFLKNRLEDEDIAKGEKKQAVALGIPGHSKMGEEEDPWANLFRDHLQGNSTLDLKGKDIKTWSPRLWIDYSHIKTLDLSNNPGLGAIVVPEEFGLMRSLQNLRLHQCGIDKLPVSLLKMEFLQNLELEKNNFKVFFDDDDISPENIQLNSLVYLNMNGNQLTQIPKVTKYIPSLKQLHLHMNKVESLNYLCRSAFVSLETFDIGGNKLTELPAAFVHYLKNLKQLVVINNDIQKLPNLVGKHAMLKNFQVEGNPLKSIRRPIIARGSAGILQYLADRYTDADAAIEEWATLQDEEDKKEFAELPAKIAENKRWEEEQRAAKEEAQRQPEEKEEEEKHHQEEEEQPEAEEKNEEHHEEHHEPVDQEMEEEEEKQQEVQQPVEAQPVQEEVKKVTEEPVQQPKSDALIFAGKNSQSQIQFGGDEPTQYPERKKFVPTKAPEA